MVHNNLGVIEFSKGHYDQALKLFNKSLELDKNYYNALTNKADCLKKMGEFQHAVNEYRKAYILYSENIEILNSLGECFINLKDFENAYNFYSASLKLDNNQTLVIKIVKQLESLSMSNSVGLDDQWNTTKSITETIKARILDNITKNMQVNFVICGTQKGGTTALYRYLNSHPEICMAENKEVHFFDNESLCTNGKLDYSQYHSFFHPGSSDKVLGEATPIYMYWHDAPRRIWEYNPLMKLIVVLRNPIDRAYSHWNMEKAKHNENLSFWDALRNENLRCMEALPYQHRIYSYIDRGFYSEQLRRLWRYFPKDNVLVLKHEYLREDPSRCLNDVCAFLGISNFDSITHINVHSYPYSSEMSANEKKYLQFIFEHEIRNIERDFGWDCSNWLS